MSIVELVKIIENMYKETVDEVKEKLDVDEDTAEKIAYSIMLYVTRDIGNI